MSGDIDFLIGIYGFAPDTDSRIISYLGNLCEKCNLDGVNVFCAERKCRPASDDLKTVVRSMGFSLLSCPLLPFSECREDTSQFCDWMVNNTGTAPWFIVSHFDVVFHADYIGYVRSLMHDADMVGNHHDGIVSVRRTAYHQCQLGFCGVDRFSICKNVHGEYWIAPNDYPYDGKDGARCLSLDVGELLAIRMHTLSLRHVWLSRDDDFRKDIRKDIGKSDLFTHTRLGSGHGNGGG